MKTFEFEPIIDAPFKIDGKIKKVKIKRLSQKSIEKIQEELENEETEEKRELKEIEKKIAEIDLDLTVWERVLQMAENKEDLLEASNKVKELIKEKANLQERERELKKETGDFIDKALCLANAADEKTKEIFEDIGEKVGWSDLSKAIAVVFEEYDKNFLSDWRRGQGRMQEERGAKTSR